MGSWLRRAWARRGGGAGGGRLAAAVCACAALGALWVWRRSAGAGAHASLATERVFPHVAAAALAHLLADFTTLPHAAALPPGSWVVEEEAGNYSSWRYSVSWACGDRCAGAASVRAVAGVGGGAWGQAPHRVRLEVRTCTRAALLWPESCDEMEILAEVWEQARGAVLRERASARCAGGAGAGACHAALRRHRDEHAARLQRAARPPPPPPPAS